MAPARPMFMKRKLKAKLVDVSPKYCVIIHSSSIGGVHARLGNNKICYKQKRLKFFM